MIGRNRRVRLTAVGVFLFIAFVLYTRRGPEDEVFEVFHPDAVGGGSVIRPKLEDIAPQAPPPPPEPAPEEPIIAPEPGLPKAPVVEQTPAVEEKPALVGDKIEEPAPISTTPTPAATTPSATPAVPATDPPSAPPAAPPVDHGYDNIQAGNAQGRVEFTSSMPLNVPKTHWQKFEEQFPVSSTIQLPTGSPKPFPRIQRATKKLETNGEDTERLAAVRAAAAHAWGGYREKAFGKDEVRPVSGKSNNPFNGWGASLVDALDTLWIIGMEKDFEEALNVVEQIDFTWSPRSDIPLFETAIRYLGGLVAAYDVSGRKYRILLDKAVELGEVLYAAFDTPNRMPQTYYRWTPAHASQSGRAGTRAVLAEIGTLSLEFTRLAQLTGEPKYYDAVARITDELEDFQNRTRLPGMWPTNLDASGCGRSPQMIVRGPGYHAAQGVKNTQPFPDGSDRDMEAGAPVVAKQRPGTSDSNPQVDRIANWAESHRQEDNNKDRLSNGASDSDSEYKNKAKRQLDLQHDTPGAPPPIEKPEMNPADVPHRNQDMTCIPQRLNSTSQSSQESFTLGGASDSVYEYLPKQHLLLGGLADQYRTMYLDSAATAIENLLFKPMTPDQRDILVSGNLKLSPNYSTPEDHRQYLERFTPEIEHLTCFAGGMFAMGGVLFDKEEHVTIGSKLTDGCVWAYSVTATGIMPESAVLMPCEETWGDCPYNKTAYWEQLDPYEHTRTVVHQPVLQPVPSTSTMDSNVPPATSQAAAAATSVAVERASDFKVEMGRDEQLRKRQLNDYTPEPAQPQPQAPQPVAAESASRQPEPAQPQPAAAAHAADQHANRPNQPDFVQLGGNRANSVAQAPVYTPPAPLNHKEYVEKKIIDERLPPGFVRINSRKYILRPEAIESVFYMYRITGDPYWREAGWNMFTAIDAQTRAPYGASAIDDVTKAAPELLDEMESFWLAETLKYFYLLFDEPSKWSLDEWVLNTEAHFFRRPKGDLVDGAGSGAGVSAAETEDQSKAPGWKDRVKRAVFG